MSQSADDLVCGFIGLGSQGAPMARQMIDAGFKTYLWARRTSSFEPFTKTTAVCVESIVELAKAVDHVGICVINDKDVREVCEQLIPNMKASSRIAIHSTVNPDTVRELKIQAEKHSLRVIDAPVSGGTPAAEAGELTVMVGADTQDIEAARPVFETFGDPIIHLGEVGAGQQAKLINNALFTANLGMSHESLNIAEKLGIDAAAFVELVRTSSGRSYGFDVRANMPPPEKFRHPAELLSKDVQLLEQIAGSDDPAFKSLESSAQRFIDFVLKS